MDSKILELEQQLEAALDYIEKISEKHEQERAQTILNAQKVRHVANKIAKERNDWKDLYEELYNAVLPVIRHIYTDHPGDEDAENHYFIALDKLRDLVEPKKHKPLESDEIRMNAGTVCDMEDGPCACGAWHKVK